jgi:hypothetical protein
MTEILSESAIVRGFAEKIAQRIARKTIYDLQRMIRMTFGGESGLKTVWDEICVHLKDEAPIPWNAYDQTVRVCLEAYVDELPTHERDALWLQTDEARDWACDDAEAQGDAPAFNGDVVDCLAHHHVYDAARSWTNPRIRAFIDQSIVRD